MSKNNESLLIAYEKGFRINRLGEIFNPNGKQLKGQKGRNGYWRFSIRHNKVKHDIYVHRLQAYQKFGKKLFEEGIQVRHLNNNQIDNSSKNIAIGSQSDNRMDLSEDVRRKAAAKATSVIIKHNHEEIRQYYKKVKSYDKVMKKFGISSKGTVNYIVRK